MGKWGTSIDKMSPADWPMNNFVVKFLTDYWCGRVQHTMNSQPLYCDSGFYKKQEEKSLKTKDVRNTSQASEEHFSRVSASSPQIPQWGLYDTELQAK